jgi:hypothetical protein
MFRRQPRAIFRGIFKPNFLLSWPSVRYVVQLHNVPKSFKASKLQIEKGKYAIMLYIFEMSLLCLNM